MTVPGNLVATLLAMASSPWTFVAAGANITGNNPTVALPTGHQAGDLLVIFGVATTSATTLPSGWTSAYNGVGTTAKLFCFYKIDNGSESNVALTSTSGIGNFFMAAWRNIAASPLDVVGTVASATGLSLATTSITTTASPDLVISHYGSGATGAGVGTWTAPGSTTVRDNVLAGNSSVGVLVVDENKASAGATTARTASISATVSLSAIQVAFKNA